MIERADQPAERALARRVGEHDARRLGLLHQIGEGEDRVAGQRCARRRPGGA